jgi:hypothetical protein
MTTARERELFERLVRSIHIKYSEDRLTRQDRKMAAVEIEQFDQSLGSALLGRVDAAPTLTLDEVMEIVAAESARLGR